MLANQARNACYLIRWSSYPVDEVLPLKEQRELP